MMRATWSALLLVGAIATPSVTAEAQGRTLQVNATDATCQGRAPCYQTIQAAVTAAAAGDHVVVQPGIYAEQVTISEKNDTSAATESDRLVIEADPAAPAGSVLLQGDGGPCTNGHGVRVQRSRLVTIRGLTIAGFGGAAIALQGGSTGTTDVHIERNRLVGNTTSSGDSCNGALTIARGNRGTVVANNLIHANGRHGVATQDADGGPHYLVGNTIHGNGWSGVRVTRNHQMLLLNNAVTGNGPAAGSTGGRFGVSRESSTAPKPSGINLLNNLICGNRLGEIDGPALDSTDAANLTPTGTEGPGVLASPGCETASVVYAHVTGVDGTAGNGDDDFTPAAGSPLIDRGIDPRTLGLGLDVVVEADYVGVARRPVDVTGAPTARFDIGALEARTPNRAPIASAGADRAVIERTTVTLDGTASADPDGDPLRFTWEQIAGPPSALAGADTATPTFTAPSVAAATPVAFQLTVSDGRASASARVTITVLPANRAPVLDPIGDRTVAVGATLTFVVSGSDPDGDPLAFAAAPLPPNATFDPASRTFRFTPDATQVGTVSVVVTASDGRGGTASETVAITVGPAVQVIIGSPAAGATVPAGSVLVRGTVRSGTPDVGVAVNGVAAAVHDGSFVALVGLTADTQALTATATTGSGVTATHTVPVSVSAVLTPAIALRAAPSSGAAPLGVVFTVSGTADVGTATLDVDGDGVVDLEGIALDGTKFTYISAGVYAAMVAATDSSGRQTRGQAIVQVFDAATLDTILQARWSALRAALGRGDVDGAVELFAVSSRDAHRDQLTALADASVLAQVAADLPTIRPSRLLDRTAEYDLRAVRYGTQYAFLVVFVVDEDGVWRLWAF